MSDTVKTAAEYGAEFRGFVTAFCHGYFDGPWTETDEGETKAIYDSAGVAWEDALVRKRGGERRAERASYHLPGVPPQ